MYLNILRKKIDKSNIISFDIFDTLIVRNCFRPSDVFKIVSEKYEKKYHSGIDFYTIRKNAEKKARQISVSSDVTLDQIYECIDLPEDIRKRYRKIELETELSICQRNYNLYDIYKYCKEKNKKIICASNMYLDKKFIKKILVKCGYDIKDVYISCEYGEKKQKGKLFKKIFPNYEIKNNKILHIGDGFKADFLGPKMVGIKSYRIKRIKNNLKYIRVNKKERELSLSDNVLLSVINNNNVMLTNEYDRIGFELVGPLCLQYIVWLNNLAIKNNEKNLLFCARDMKMIMDFYNIYFDDKIKNNYLYISRKSTYLPFLYKFNSYEDFISIFPTEKIGVSIPELLNMINIELDKSIDVKKYKLDLNTKYSLKKLFNNANFEKFYNEYIKKEIKKAGKVQYNNLIYYINDLTSNEDFSITDLGWRGTTQKILNMLFNKNINGYYFGLINKQEEIKNNSYSFITSDDNMKKIYSFAEVLELFLSALHGTTLSYSNDKTKPVELGKSKNENNDCILSIQKGAYLFFEIIKEYRIYLENENSDLFINNFIRIGIEPSLHNAKTFGNINSESYSNSKIASPNSLIHYLFNTKELKRNFISSGWKVGFMKRLLKIRLPYYKIYLFLKRKNRRKNGK